MFLTNATIVDTFFIQMVESQKAECLKNLVVFRWNEEVKDYVKGNVDHYLRPWRDADVVYITRTYRGIIGHFAEWSQTHG